jgi:hypothetical protein
MAVILRYPQERTSIQDTLELVGFEVLIAVVMKSSIFWDNAM